MKILSQQSLLLEVIALGCFLIATMASLRFRDLLRSKPESLSIQGHILRGISWRAKTSVSGQPWGVCCIGIFTRPSTGHWVFRFLEALQIGIDKKSRTNWSPDFLLSSWTDPVPFSSCSYHHISCYQMAVTSPAHTRASIKSIHSQDEINFTCCAWTAQP